MPHTLELAADPHRTLAEVARVLRPEGKVVVLGSPGEPLGTASTPGPRA